MYFNVTYFVYWINDVYLDAVRSVRSPSLDHGKEQTLIMDLKYYKGNGDVTLAGIDGGVPIIREIDFGIQNNGRSAPLGGEEVSCSLYLNEQEVKRRRLY